MIKQCLLTLIILTSQAIAMKKVKHLFVRPTATDFSQAINNKNIDEIKYCLESALFGYLDLNSCKEELSEALVLLASSGHAPYVKDLLVHPNIKASIKDKDGVTALIYAASCGHAECVKAILSNLKNDLRLRGKYNYRALIDAGHNICNRALFSDSNIDVNLIDNEGDTALIYAARNGYTDCVKVLLNHSKINVNLHDKRGNSALFEAVSSRNADCIKALLAHPNINVNIQNRTYKDTPLIEAARNGSTDCAKALLAHSKIDLTLANVWDVTALIAAAICGHYECIKTLLSCRNIDVNIRDEEDRTALFWAAQGGYTDCVKALLFHPKIDVNIRDKKGHTALMATTDCEHDAKANKKEPAPTERFSVDAVTQYKRSKCTKALLSHPNINVNLKDNEGNTALMLTQNIRCIKALVSHANIDVNIQNNQGKSALMLLARSMFYFFNCIPALFYNSNINVHLKDNEGSTALEMAYRAGHREDMLFLIASGADSKSLVDYSEYISKVIRKGESIYNQVLNALKSANKKILCQLIQDRYTPNIRDAFGNGPMHIVIDSNGVTADNNRLALVKFLYTYNPGFATSINNAGQTAIDRAPSNEEILHFFVEVGYQKETSLLSQLKRQALRQLTESSLNQAILSIDAHCIKLNLQLYQ